MLENKARFSCTPVWGIIRCLEAERRQGTKVAKHRWDKNNLWTEVVWGKGGGDMDMEVSEDLEGADNLGGGRR